MAFDPFQMMRSAFSGDVTQWITTPWFSPTFNFAGNQTIEAQVVKEVASYGKQIGWLNEMVLALAQANSANLPPDVKDTLDRMVKAAAEIEKIKKVNEQSALDAAVSAMNRLQAEHPASYEILLHSRRPIGSTAWPSSTHKDAPPLA